MHFRTQNARTQRLYPAVGYAIAGCAAWAYQEAAPVLLFLASCVFFSAAFVVGWAWGFDVVAKFVRSTRKPYEPPDEVRIVEAVSRMDANQVWLTALYMGYNLEEQEPEDPTVEGEDFTKSYAISKLDSAVRKDGYLEPVRSFSDGTAERQYQTKFINYLVAHGWADPAAGNKPARVTDYQTARREILE